MSASRIEYSEKYADEMNEYRYVKSIIQVFDWNVKKSQIMSDILIV